MIPNLIVPVLNRYDLLRRMLASLDYPIRDLLIIDNGGKFEDLFARDELPVKTVRVLNLPSNLGVAASWNLGIKLFPHDDRWFFASNDMWFDPGDLKVLSQARRDAVTLSHHYPYWQTFALGETVVGDVGLFDERFYPAYFEDSDYLRRCDIHNIPIDRVNVARGHDNSSTINADPALMAKNAQTFQRNQVLHDSKTRGFSTEWSWNLESRRAGEWLSVN